MSTPIEDHALLSDGRTAALVTRLGSVDWFCAPRFDSPSIFGALLGDADHGRWALRPDEPVGSPVRHYDGDSFVLVTRWLTSQGEAEVREFMPIDGHPAIVRRVVGLRGRVRFRTELTVRFDYARTVPWVRRTGTTGAPELRAIGGPDALVIRGVELRADGKSHHGEFEVAPGEVVDLTLAWHPSHRPPPPAFDVSAALASTRAWWLDWAGRINQRGLHRDEVVRSLLVLHALSDRSTGGIIAAPTTSLPEKVGGSRNWDYRYVWLRDAALTLEALLAHGFLDVAEHWRNWLLRAVAGDPAQLQVMYGIAGERDLAEHELPWLPGYERSSPVRIGNAAVAQYQADVAGEVLVALEAARLAGLVEDEFSWPLQRAILGDVLDNLDRPGQGIWEVRGEPRQFTHSRAMIWAALDRGERAVERWGLPGDRDAWAAGRDRLANEIDTLGVAPEGHFTRSYGEEDVDASLLLLPTVGYCRPEDPRMLATVALVERDLMPDGLVLRYRPGPGADGVQGSENPFLACTFWLVEQYARVGRREDALRLMDRACGCANDLGLLSEEYDPIARRQAGNMPQAFSHLALVRAADALGGHGGRAAHRG